MSPCLLDYSADGCTLQRRTDGRTPSPVASLQCDRGLCRVPTRNCHARVISSSIPFVQRPCCWRTRQVGMFVSVDADLWDELPASRFYPTKCKDTNKPVHLEHNNQSTRTNASPTVSALWRDMRGTCLFRSVRKPRWCAVGGAAAPCLGLRSSPASSTCSRARRARFLNSVLPSRDSCRQSLYSRPASSASAVGGSRVRGRAQERRHRRFRFQSLRLALGHSCAYS